LATTGILLALAGCGSDPAPTAPGSQPGTVPPPAERDWQAVTLDVTRCPVGVASEPPCQLGSFSVDDEGGYQLSDPSRSGKLTDAQLETLDARIDEVKAAGTTGELRCDAASIPEAPDGSVRITFADGGQPVVLSHEDGSTCFRGDLAASARLQAELAQLRFEHSCGCTGDICVDCTDPA
jgi:hypothetical protein